jgi:hypothetical protein
MKSPLELTQNIAFSIGIIRIFTPPVKGSKPWFSDLAGQLILIARL